MKKLIIKNKTNGNESCKQYFYVIGIRNNDAAIIIKKYILSNRENIVHFTKVKKFKNTTLYYQEFSIRVNTFEQVRMYFTSNVN